MAIFSRENGKEKTLNGKESSSMSIFSVHIILFRILRPRTYLKNNLPVKHGKQRHIYADILKER